MSKTQCYSVFSGWFEIPTPDLSAYTSWWTLSTCLRVHNCDSPGEDRPRYRIILNPGDSDHFVFAEDLAALMQVLAEWVPTLERLSW